MKFMYGTLEACKYVLTQSETQIFTFNSLYEGFVSLNLLPPNNLGAIDEYDFDLKYFQYVFGDDLRFLRLFGIVLAMFNGYDVFIVSDKYGFNLNWEDNLIESFLKMLQSRYGFVGYLVNSVEDYMNAGETDFDLRFGVQNMDADYKRYLNICKRLGKELYNYDFVSV